MIVDEIINTCNLVMNPQDVDLDSVGIDLTNLELRHGCNGLLASAAKSVRGINYTAMDFEHHSGLHVTLINKSDYNITFKHADAAAPEPNRIYMSNDADYILIANSIVKFHYVSKVGRSGWWIE